jgi:hypothetical protein
MAGLDPATQCAIVREREWNHSAGGRAGWMAASRAAMVKTQIYPTPFAISRSLNFCTLPVEVFGSSANTT